MQSICEHNRASNHRPSTLQQAVGILGDAMGIRDGPCPMKDKHRQRQALLPSGEIARWIAHRIQHRESAHKSSSMVHEITFFLLDVPLQDETTTTSGQCSKRSVQPYDAQVNR